MMNNLQHFKGYEHLIARLDDLKASSEKYYKSYATNFLTEEETEIARRYLGKQSNYKIYGGYEDARRCKVVFFNNEEDDFFDIVCLVAKLNNKFNNIKHPDVLGSIMSLNINRDQIGDIFIKEDKIIIFVNKTIADFIIMNLTMIKRVKVNFAISDEQFDLSYKYKEFKTTISSERIDVIVGALCHLNRQQAQRLIYAKQVQLNHVTIEDCAKICNNNCTISIRHYGRFIYLGVDKTTKKDRLLVSFKQYI